MPRRAFSICKHPGCPALLLRPGYCPAHQRSAPDPHAALRELDKRKTDQEREFYSSARWTRVSRRHRRQEPLCRPCKKKGQIVAGELVHHNPPLKELLARGLNPYDDEYLETLCNRCHMAELRAKRS